MPRARPVIILENGDTIGDVDVEEGVEVDDEVPTVEDDRFFVLQPRLVL